ncbi:hypothetical protein F5B21DRAFT_509930 [Xylaria acuta]|nr:hypothetical protein F5B21DRAFT_509930 [Xylaria acuta]
MPTFTLLSPSPLNPSNTPPSSSTLADPLQEPDIKAGLLDFHAGLESGCNIISTKLNHLAQAYVRTAKNRLKRSADDNNNDCLDTNAPQPLQPLPPFSIWLFEQVPAGSEGLVETAVQHIFRSPWSKAKEQVRDAVSRLANRLYVSRWTILLVFGTAALSKRFVDGLLRYVKHHTRTNAHPRRQDGGSGISPLLRLLFDDVLSYCDPPVHAATVAITNEFVSIANFDIPSALPLHPKHIDQAIRRRFGPAVQLSPRSKLNEGPAPAPAPAPVLPLAAASSKDSAYDDNHNPGDHGNNDDSDNNQPEIGRSAPEDMAPCTPSPMPFDPDDGGDCQPEIGRSAPEGVASYTPSRMSSDPDNSDNDLVDTSERIPNAPPPKLPPLSSSSYSVFPIVRHSPDVSGARSIHGQNLRDFGHKSEQNQTEVSNMQTDISIQLELNDDNGVGSFSIGDDDDDDDDGDDGVDEVDEVDDDTRGMQGITFRYKRKFGDLSAPKGKEEEKKGGKNDTSEPRPKIGRVGTGAQMYQTAALAPARPADGREQGQGSKHEPCVPGRPSFFTSEAQWSAVQHLAPGIMLNDDAINLTLWQLTHRIHSSYGDDGNNDAIEFTYNLSVLTSWESESIIACHGDEDKLARICSRLRAKWKTEFAHSSRPNKEREEEEEEEQQQQQAQCEGREDHELRHLIIPVHLATEVHWVLYYWNGSTNTLACYDSFAGQSYDRKDATLRSCSAHLLKFLALLYPQHVGGQHDTRTVTGAAAQQTNGYDCGLHVIANVHAICSKLRWAADGVNRYNWRHNTFNPSFSDKMRTLLAFQILTSPRDTLIVDRSSTSNVATIITPGIRHLHEISTFQMQQSQRHGPVPNLCHSFTPTAQAYQDEVQAGIQVAGAAGALAFAHAKHMRVWRLLETGRQARAQKQAQRDALAHFVRQVPDVTHLAALLDTTGQQQRQAEGIINTIVVDSDENGKGGKKNPIDISATLQLAGLPPRTQTHYIHVAETAQRALFSLQEVLSDFDERLAATTRDVLAAENEVEKLTDQRAAALMLVHAAARSYCQAIVGLGKKQD